MLLLLLCHVLLSVADITPVPRMEITPVPRRNPHELEFNNMDSDGDRKLTFTEFLLADRPYIEQQSRAFHKFDVNGDGQISSDEFLQFYKHEDDERRHRENERRNFFDHLGHGFSSPFFDSEYFDHQRVTPIETGNKTVNETAKATMEIASMVY